MNMKKHSYFCLTTEFALAIMNAKLKFYSHFKNKLSHSLAAGSDTIACGKVKRRKGMPIVLAPTNQQLRIVRIAADDKLKKHLESLGITLDGEITVLSSSGGSVVVKVKDGRIALDGNLSTKIFVA